MCVNAASRMMQHLRQKHYLPKGWSDTIGGIKQVRLTLQVASWDFAELNLCPVDQEEPPFLKAAVEELAKGTT